MSKKLISLAVAVFMVAAMLPMSSVSANDTNAVYQFRYDFSMAAGLSADLDVNTVTYKNTNGHWAHSGFVYQTGSSWLNQVKGNRLNLATAGGKAWVALKINVPVSGVYDVKYDYLEISTSSATGDVYVFPAGTTLTPAVKFGEGANNIASKGTKIAADISYYNATGTTTEKYATYEDLTLTAGENLIVFVATTKAGNTYPSALTLTTADATSNEYTDVYVGEVSVEETTLDVETNPTTTASVYASKMSDKTVIDASNIIFKSSDEDVLTVSGDGTVTAVGAGTATVYATCTEPSVGNIMGKVITVTAPTYKIAYTFDNRIVSTGDTNMTSVTDYAHTNGLWKYYTMKENNGISSLKNNRLEMSLKNTDGYIALSINVPKTDVYDIDYYHYGVANRGATGDVYILPGDTSLSDIEAAKASGKKLASVDYSVIANGTKTKTDTVKNVSLIKGENILLFVATGEGENNTQAEYKYNMYPSSLVLTNAAGDINAETLEPVYVGTVSVDKAELKKGESATAVAKVYTADTTDDGVMDGVAQTSGITFKSSDEAVAKVDANTGAVTAVGEGKATIFAEIENGSIIGSGISVSLSAEEILANAFNAASENVKYTPSALTGLTVDGDVINGEPNGDGTYNLTAPEKNDAGYSFCYWAKGLDAKKRILLYQTNELKNYVPDENGVTYLIPVYEDMLPKTDEYYNANGQLLPDATSSDAAYMAGYGETSEWERYGDTNIYVAKYNKTKPDDVTVTVKDGTGGGTVPYGEPVTCKADDTKGIFQWWEKDVNGTSEIVSIDKEYSFLAYKDCTVTAVYGTAVAAPANPAKIIIDTFGENSIMAEFIGITNAVEKGIMFGTQKIAMTAPGNQFTVTADRNGTYKGYAIVGNENDGYTLITDGSVTISDAE